MVLPVQGLGQGHPNPVPTDLDTETTSPRPRRRRWRFFRAAAIVVIFIGLLGTGAALWMKGRAVELPEWLRDDLSARLAAELPDLDIRFGSLELVVQQNWRPRIFVGNLDVRSANGQEIVTVRSARAAFDPSALLNGRLALTALNLSGVLVNLRREADGRFELSAVPSSGAQAARRGAPNLAALVAELDDLLQRPGWRALRLAQVDTLTMRYEDARAGRAWTVDGGQLTLRRGGNDLELSVDLSVLGGDAEAARLSASYASVIGEAAAQFGVTIANLAAGDIASQGAAFAWLQAVDAPLSGAVRGGVDSEGAFEPLHATLQIGAGAIQPRPEARPLPIMSASSYFTYFPGEELLRFSALDIASPAGSGRLEGEARLSGEGRVDGLLGQLRLTNLTVAPQPFYDLPVTLEEAELDFRLTLKPFLLEVGRLDVTDDGKRLSLTGEAGAGPDGWTIALDAAMDALDPSRLLALWPQTVGEKTKRWMSENILDGTLYDINAALRFRPGQTRPDLHLGFDFAGADVRFLKEMPPIRNGKGHASLTADRFVAVIDEGAVEAPSGGHVELAGSSFIVPDVRAREEAPGVIRLQTRSSIEAALSMLDQPPLEIMQKAGQPVDLAEGSVDLTGTLALPLVKGVQMDRVTFHFDGDLTDVTSSRLIPERRIEADRLDLQASDASLSIGGEGRLDGVPFEATWVQPLGKGRTDSSRVTGRAVLSQAALETFRVSLPDGTLRGDTEALLDIALQKGEPPRLSLRSNLRGIAISVPPINWLKAADTRGRFELDAILGPVPDVERLLLDAPGLTAAGEVSLTADRQLDRVSLDRLQVGGWLDAPVDLVGRGAEVPPRIVLRGGRLDLRSADLGSGGATGETVPLDVTLERLQLTDAISLDGLRGDFTVGGGLRGSFSAQVNGAAPIRGQVAPQDGRTAVRVTADDAGAVVAAAGALRQARGGALELLLEPVGTGGAFDGQLRVTDLRITDAPAMAALLNAISIVGLVNELAGDGIYFDEVTADFRLAPSQVTVRRASAEGASMGLSMDGVYRTDTGAIQMQGVISPVYLLNRIGSVLTRAGEGLFGFNYSITGTTQNPQVFVNPLSALAPGGLRDIFRAPRPEVPLEQGEARPPPEPSPRPPPVVTPGGDR